MTTGNFVHGVPPAALDNLLELGTPTEEIKWRAGAKQHDGPCDRPCRQPHVQLAYVDARYVMRVLDSALIGPSNWQCVYLPTSEGITFCGIGIRINYGTEEDPSNQWVWKWNGAGETDIEGEKGAASDAMKRAAVLWGIGRDLYSMKPGQRPATAPRPIQQQTQAAPQYRREDLIDPIAEARAEIARTLRGENIDLVDGLDEELGPRRVVTPQQDEAEGECPYHGKPWRHGQYGWYCSGKGGDGPINKKGYCDAKPSKVWQARQERAA